MDTFPKQYYFERSHLLKQHLLFEHFLIWKASFAKIIFSDSLLEKFYFVLKMGNISNTYTVREWPWSLSVNCLLNWIRCTGRNVLVDTRLRSPPIGFAEFTSCSMNQSKFSLCFVWGEISSDCIVQVHNVYRACIIPLYWQKCRVTIWIPFSITFHYPIIGFWSYGNV